MYLYIAKVSDDDNNVTIYRGTQDDIERLKEQDVKFFELNEEVELKLETEYTINYIQFIEFRANDLDDILEDERQVELFENVSFDYALNECKKDIFNLIDNNFDTNLTIDDVSEDVDKLKDPIKEVEFVQIKYGNLLFMFKIYKGFVI